MKNNFKFYCLLHAALVIFALTSVASKFASGADFLSVRFICFYGLVILGLGIYAVLWQQIIKHLPLITAYANKAVTVIWGLIFGYFIFGEKITIRKLIGAVIIIAGVYLIVTADAMDEQSGNIPEENKSLSEKKEESMQEDRS